jgi:hypothetical protein
MFIRGPRSAWPLVCLDETSEQLASEARTPLPMKPGRQVRADYEHERGAAANLFMLFASPEGFRHVEVTDRRTAIPPRALTCGARAAGQMLLALDKDADSNRRSSIR